ncbi:MAG: enoyl-CoA hydratase-related protein [Bacteroidales bacterium]|nr:enoyl-CoA hydratase-related protein [Bacteroidales bacterium]
MEYTFVKYEIIEQGIALLSINSPATLNALSRQVLEDIDRCISRVDLSSVSVLIITGAGEKAFVAGADISQMAGLDKYDGEEFGNYGSRIFNKIEDLKIPVIAAVNGFALGGGCELAMACDIRIASDKARFGQPEVKLGIIPGFSGTYRLAKLVGQGYAKEMIYSGRMINAEEALRIGLVNHVVPAGELMEYVLNLSRDIRANAPIAVSKAKSCINCNYDMSRGDAISMENIRFGECFDTEDQKEGMEAFLAKRVPHFTKK